MDKLYCKLEGLDKLRMSSIKLAKLYCKFDELAKLRMSSMSWISCTISWKLAK